MKKTSARKVKYLILLGLALALLLLAGCSSQKVKNTPDYNFKQGTGELQVKFLPNSPPEKLYPFSTFKLILGLDNQQAYDVTNGKVVLLGIDGKYFQVEPLEQTFDPLMGRSVLNPGGEKTYLEFEGKANHLFQNAEEYVANYFVKLTYNSKMDFSDSVCINPKFYDLYDSGCKVQAKKSYSGQGAPLAVTNMETIISPSGSGVTGVEFRLTLKNRGKGEVRKATVTSANLGGKELDCNFQGAWGNKSIEMSPDMKEPVLICITYVKESLSYTTTFLVNFAYSYEIEQKQRLRLVK